MMVLRGVEREKTAKGSSEEKEEVGTGVHYPGDARTAGALSRVSTIWSSFARRKHGKKDLKTG
jgi:hypothetical protein